MYARRRELSPLAAPAAASSLDSGGTARPTSLCPKLHMLLELRRESSRTTCGAPKEQPSPGISQAPVPPRRGNSGKADRLLERSWSHRRCKPARPDRRTGKTLRSRVPNCVMTERGAHPPSRHVRTTPAEQPVTDLSQLDDAVVNGVPAIHLDTLSDAVPFTSVEHTPAAEVFADRHIGRVAARPPTCCRSSGTRPGRLVDAAVPASIRTDRPLDLPAARSEEEVLGGAAHDRGPQPGETQMIGQGYSDTITPDGHPAERPRVAGLVHRVHAVPAGDRAGPAGGAAQLPDDGHRPHGPGRGERVAARRGHRGRGGGRPDVARGPAARPARWCSTPTCSVSRSPSRSARAEARPAGRRRGPRPTGCRRARATSSGRGAAGRCLGRVLDPRGRDRRDQGAPWRSSRSPPTCSR